MLGLFHVEIEAYCLLPLHRFGDMISENERAQLNNTVHFDLFQR